MFYFILILIIISQLYPDDEACCACCPAHALLRSLTTTVLTQSVSPHDCSQDQLVLWEGSGARQSHSAPLQWSGTSSTTPTTSSCPPLSTVSQPDNVKHTQHSDLPALASPSTLQQNNLQLGILTHFDNYKLETKLHPAVGPD